MDKQNARIEELLAKMEKQSARIEELLAKEEIKETLYRLARGTDRQDAALIKSCYHPDAVDDHGLYKQKGHDFAELVARSTLGHCQHFVGQISIQLKGNVAFVETYNEYHHIMEATDTTELRDDFIGSRWLDRFEKRGDGPWLIANRVVCWDWRFFLPASAQRRQPDTCVWGARGELDGSYHIEKLTSKKG